MRDSRCAAPAWSTTATAACSTSRSATPTSRRGRIVPSVGSVGDSYDNALAETVIGLFKTEVIRGSDLGAASRP